MVQKFLFTFFSGSLLLTQHAFAQENFQPNLLVNGDFESGYKKFTSDYLFRDEFILPGTFVITSDATSAESDFKNPLEGDHTSGSGNFLILDSDGNRAKKIWRYKVNVKPNSIYRFSLYFTNVYKHQGSNGIMINGFAVGYHQKNNFVKVKAYLNNKPLGEEQTDIFHKYRWVFASWEWYSGTLDGPVELSIDNPNTNIAGNDLAIDDIELILIETKPAGYKLPKRETVMLPENQPKPDNRLRLVTKQSDNPLEFYVGDSLGDGIYTIGKRRPLVVSKPRLKDRNMLFENLAFEKGKAEMKQEAYEELENLSTFLTDFPDLRVRLEGHTDNLGDSLINHNLSEERVSKVKKYLIEKGIDAGRIETIAFGGTRLLSKSLDEEQKKLNRRVEIVILGR